VIRKALSYGNKSKTARKKKKILGLKIVRITSIEQNILWETINVQISLLKEHFRTII
jgi:hypothetical protein